MYFILFLENSSYSLCFLKVLLRNECFSLEYYRDSLGVDKEAGNESNGVYFLWNENLRAPLLILSSTINRGALKY
jgi:hypothetical protein